MLAELLSKRFGFETTVLFAVDPKDGMVNPNTLDNIPGLEKLEKADLLILLIRMRKLPPKQMAYFESYFKAGKPVIGLRTATHAFATTGDYQKWGWTSKVPGFEGGFGRVVLGRNLGRAPRQTWQRRDTRRSAFRPNGACGFERHRPSDDIRRVRCLCGAFAAGLSGATLWRGHGDAGTQFGTGQGTEK